MLSIEELSKKYRTDEMSLQHILQAKNVKPAKIRKDGRKKTEEYNEEEAYNAIVGVYDSRRQNYQKMADSWAGKISELHRIRHERQEQ